jgi:hypothetical protein
MLVLPAVWRTLNDALGVVWCLILFCRKEPRDESSNASNYYKGCSWLNKDKKRVSIVAFFLNVRKQDQLNKLKVKQYV